MPEKWTGDVVAKMHVNQITYRELAAELGVSKEYTGMILNGVRKPPEAEQRINAAIDNILQRRNAIQAEQEG